MKIVQMPIIKSNQKQELISWRRELGFVIDRGNFWNSEQVLPVQINKSEIDGNSSGKDSNKQTYNKTEDIAIENVQNNKV